MNSDELWMRHDATAVQHATITPKQNATAILATELHPGNFFDAERNAMGLARNAHVTNGCDSGGSTCHGHGHDFDVCIVGGGPGGLAALSAVIEPYSMDHLSESQRQRAEYAAEKQKRRNPKVCVIDPEPWLNTWHKRFKALDIKRLRSPAGAHPDIFDMHSLLAFAHQRNREHDLLDSGAVNPELQSLDATQVGRGLWKLPSNDLFEHFCSHLASCLPHSFVRGKAASIEGEDGDFRVILSDGRELTAKAVVLALGVPGPAVVPAALSAVPNTLMFHSDDLSWRGEDLRKKRVLVLGGGLTAVQVAQLALKKGCKVVLASRRPLTTRHFDIGEAWFDWRKAHLHHFEFFQKPLEERLKHIKATRGGGSVPPMYMKELCENKRLTFKCGEVQVVSVHEDSVDVLIDGEAHHFDLIVNACGHRPDCKQLPLIGELLKTRPVEVVGGFPTLSPDLQWGDFKQLFIIGALASLQVGPDAGNLMGLRRAVQIVANALDLRAWLRDTKSVLQNIRGNRYDALGDSDSADSADSEDSADSDSDSD